MPLTPGTKLGPYEISKPLGAGGMGEVYEANDTRLDRTVAIKVLPEHLSYDSERRERFEREARAVSSLNHPHICTLHDVGEHDGIHFLVMELVEGESLADRLQKGALPFEQVVEYAAQIADALDKAHRAGIVHRDLKPGNVMLTKTGVKLLDFGLAKTREDNIAAGHDSEQPTQNKPLTGEGTILGTVQYMAPEQLEGKDVDARADLFALGAVLYEMLTGRKAFEGESQASLISAIMSTDPPPVSELQAMSPPALDRLVKKCLAKDPEDRWHSAHDLVTALRWTSETTPEGRKTAFRARPVAVALGALVVGVLVAWGLVPRLEPSPVVTVLDIALPPDEPLRDEYLSVALSRDGSHIAYTTTRGLYVRARSDASATAIPSSQDACCPFFSPDGEWLGFFIGTVLEKVSIRGGAPLIVVDARGNGAKGTWGNDGNIVYGRGNTSGIFRVSASGGPIDVLASRAEDDLSYAWPELLPGGGAVLYELLSPTFGDGTGQIVVQALATGERKVLIERGTNPQYASSGHLAYGVDSTLWAVPFDIDQLELTGEPFPVTEGVATLGRSGAQFSISEDGTLAYVSGGYAARRIVWVDRSGKSTRVVEAADAFVHSRLSPDGGRIAASLHPVGTNHDIWIYDIGAGTRSRLTTTWHNNFPVWTPDGTPMPDPEAPQTLLASPAPAA